MKIILLISEKHVPWITSKMLFCFNTNDNISPSQNIFHRKVWLIIIYFTFLPAQHTSKQEQFLSNITAQPRSNILLYFGGIAFSSFLISKCFQFCLNGLLFKECNQHGIHIKSIRHTHSLILGVKRTTCFLHIQTQMVIRC